MIFAHWGLRRKECHTTFLPGFMMGTQQKTKKLSFDFGQLTQGVRGMWRSFIVNLWAPRHLGSLNWDNANIQKSPGWRLELLLTWIPACIIGSNQRHASLYLLLSLSFNQSSARPLDWEAEAHWWLIQRFNSPLSITYNETCSTEMSRMTSLSHEAGDLQKNQNKGEKRITRCVQIRQRSLLLQQTHFFSKKAITFRH